MIFMDFFFSQLCQQGVVHMYHSARWGGWQYKLAARNDTDHSLQFACAVLDGPDEEGFYSPGKGPAIPCPKQGAPGTITATRLSSITSHQQDRIVIIAQYNRSRFVSQGARRSCWCMAGGRRPEGRRLARSTRHRR